MNPYHISLLNFRDIPSSGGYFVIYEYSKRTLSLGKESTKLTQFVAGGIAGINKIKS